MKILFMSILLAFSSLTMANDCVAWYKVNYGMSDSKAFIACGFGPFGKALVESGYSVSIVMLKLQQDYTTQELKCLDNAVNSGKTAAQAEVNCYDCKNEFERNDKVKNQILTMSNISDSERSVMLDIVENARQTVRQTCDN